MTVPQAYPSFLDLRKIQSAFDIIGDVHGCADELCELLTRLGYSACFKGSGEDREAIVETPPGRLAIFVGDLVDRGPKSPDAIRIAMALVNSNRGYAVIGNHDAKFGRWLQGRQVKLAHGLDRTAQQFQNESPSFKASTLSFIERLPPYLWLADGQLAVAHAGIKEDMLGKISHEIRSFCLFGETSGSTDEMGLPVRYNWAAEYEGDTSVVYGHTPVPNAEWQNNTLCLDTGCCFGGRLSALRWPEREIVSIPAAATYSPPVRPFGHPPPRPKSTV